MWHKIWLVGCLFYSGNVLAVSSIEITADQIQHDEITLKQADISLHISKQPTVSINSQFKQNSESPWATAKLVCALPKHLNQEAWHCQQGAFNSASFNFPFSLHIHPQSNGFTADIALDKASFSDEQGLHAAENLTGNLKLEIKQEGKHLRWQHVLDWDSGEVYWDPYYVEGGGHQFAAAGLLKDDEIHFDHARFALKEVGLFDFSGQLQRDDFAVKQLQAHWQDLDLATAYPMLFQPMMEQSILNQTELNGRADLKFSIDNKTLKTFHLKLKDANIDDNENKFAFYNINADIPWDYEQAKHVTIAYTNGNLLNMPLGKTKLDMEVNRYALTAPHLTIPMLDGALHIKALSAARLAGLWHWHVGAQLDDITMPALSHALQWPRMEGAASATIPQMTYSGGILTIDGETVFNVFNGQATLTNLVMINPLSGQPKLHADMQVRNLDLGDITRTFSFGAIEGKLDGDIADLEMQNWKTVKFDAELRSSPGKYRKKISQRAVENISALGGAGAAAAIQRSFLRFFENFNYAKIGISCRLRNDVCLMDGVESTNGGYVIVKGKGLPAINVMGFNRTVGWDDLLGRIKRVTDDNTKAVVE